MPDQTQDPQTDPQQQQQSPEPSSNDDPEKGFWERLDKVVEAAADRVVEKRLKSARDNGTQRGTGRTTLPKMLADIMFGPEK